MSRVCWFFECFRRLKDVGLMNSNCDMSCANLLCMSLFPVFSKSSSLLSLLSMNIMKSNL